MEVVVVVYMIKFPNFDPVSYDYCDPGTYNLQCSALKEGAVYCRVVAVNGSLTLNTERYTYGVVNTGSGRTVRDGGTGPDLRERSVLPSV
ncbi:unnamed protein product [Medioppia subpectinata]|uniref:Uncharacterized protein n=1 Tax=Medioppia subpectinata TaxID=1979941 RepID=A0A7R9KHE5_9ACAR|nr:unnamed protein product [Medioppia subpectinata]CAG2103588.1 unnamed protein product [Medioppia subpectinata]